ncbi:MAG: ribonuclease III [Gammaproteobacteria bacterium]|nr:ribonuclease III [Gammaproteobacteria bacterium]
MIQSADLPAKWLDKKFDYRFSDESLFLAAVTHRSAGGRNNERLEYLGDAILGFLVAKNLYHFFPTASEGELTRRRAALVRRETLAEIAMELDLGAQLKLGSGELKSGGFRRDSILADSLEALLGAIFLDGGLTAVEEIIDSLFHERMVDAAAGELKDPKTRLQEYLQSRGLSLPLYEVTETLGQSHEQIFRVSCNAADLELSGLGTGSSRRRAEQCAAANVLENIDNG